MCAKKLRVSFTNLHIYANGESLGFCVHAQIFLFWSFCEHAQIFLFWSFCRRLEKLRISIRNLRIYANGERLEFLRICADFLV